jgi:hypothetical protein
MEAWRSRDAGCKVKSEIAAQVLPLIEVSAAPSNRIPIASAWRACGSMNGRCWNMRARRPPTSPRPREKRRPLQPAIPARHRRRRRPSSAAVSSTYAQESYCLGVLLRQPDLLYQVDRRMQEEGLPRLSVDDFVHADHQAILRLFQESVDQDMAEPLNFVFNSLSLPMMEMADGLLTHRGTGSG